MQRIGIAGWLFAAVSLFSGCEAHHQHTFGKWGAPRVLELDPPWPGKYVQERTCTSCGIVAVNVIME